MKNKYLPFTIVAVLMCVVCNPAGPLRAEHPHECQPGEEKGCHDEHHSSEKPDNTEHRHEEQHHHEEESGKVVLSRQAANAAGITTEQIQSAELYITSVVYGKIHPNRYRTSHLSARFPGVVKKVHKELGDSVEKGEVLAIIESSESLSTYTIRSPLKGTLIKRTVSEEEVVAEDTHLFVVSDLDTVWAELHVFSKNSSHIAIGDQVVIEDSRTRMHGEAIIDTVSPVIDEKTQMLPVRAVLKNENNYWRPGQYIQATIVVEKVEVSRAVKKTALQRLEGEDVIFVRHGKVFQPISVKLGRQDKEWAEIVSGSGVGAEYVSTNSYLLKADVLKSGAAHHH